MGEHCSSNEFSSAVETKSNCKSRAVRDWYSLLTQNKNKSCATTGEPPKTNNRILQVIKNNEFATID